MESTFPKRVLRAALFDALKAAITLFGGVGSGVFYVEQEGDRNPKDPKTPLCALGFLHYVGALKKPVSELIDSIAESKDLIGFGWRANDAGVNAIRRSLGLETYHDGLSSELPRVPFDQWAEYFNLQRAVELPAAVYDALKASSDKFGGIGAGWFFEHDTPLCARGHCWAIQRNPAHGADTAGPLEVELERALGGGGRFKGVGIAGPSDRAVQAINERKGAYHNARVTFEEWANELKIVRGAQ